eukprot:s5375_g7.t3
MRRFLPCGCQGSCAAFLAAMGSCAGRCRQLYEAVVPDDVDSEDDAQLREPMRPRQQDDAVFPLRVSEKLRQPHGFIRLIVVPGRRQVGKTSVVLEHFNNENNVYYHEEARAMQLGLDLDHTCGSQHLHKGHIQRIVGKVHEKSRQNVTVIFDIPHNAEDADVTRVYEDLKGMVYDDTTHRRPVLSIIILSNHYQVDAFPRDKGRFETLWVGNLEESEATEFVAKLHADTSDTGTGLRELAWANRLPRWKQEVEYSVRHARADPDAEALMAMMSEQGAHGLRMTRLLNLRFKLSFPRGVLLRQEAVAFQDQMTQRSEL